jgi:deoxyribose-phosphate aldolase
MHLTRADLASRIDHTILKPEASSAEVHRVATEAMQNGFASVCVAPVWVGRVATMVRDFEPATRVCTVVGFPHGTNKSTLKAIEATSSIKDGADEIDVVAHLPHLLNADVPAIKAELIEIVRAARATRPDVVIKVILETALLLQALGPRQGEAALAAGCRAARESGCDFVKTTTGFHPSGGATVDAVALLRKYAEGLQVKAAGGIRDLKAARAMLQAGADRLGMSNSLAVLDELNAGIG